MANRRLNNIDLDQTDSTGASDNDEEQDNIDQPSTVPKSSDDDNQRNFNNNHQTDDDDEVISPRRNRHTVVLSDDDEEHIVRLDLHQQVHDEKLERMLNLGVAERRRPVRDRMHTVAKLVDGHVVYSVEPAECANSTAAAATSTTEKQADCDNVSDLDNESEGQADEENRQSRSQKNIIDASDEENSEDREFIVSDSATPSYHESANSSSHVDSLEEDAVDKQADGSIRADEAGRSDGVDCQCQCNCPACRRCEFKCRRRWLRKKAKMARTDNDRQSTDDNREASDGNRGACSGKKRHSKHHRITLKDSDVDSDDRDNDDSGSDGGGWRLNFEDPDHDDDNSNAVKFITQKRKRYS